MFVAARWNTITTWTLGGDRRSPLVDAREPETIYFVMRCAVDMPSKTRNATPVV